MSPEKFIRCQQNPRHIFSSHNSFCPWCKFAENNYDPFLTQKTSKNIPKNDPELCNFYYTNANKMFKDKNFLNAQIEYEKVLHLSPNHIHSLTEYAYCLCMNNREAESLIIIEDILKMDPKYADMWRFKGDILKILGKCNDAIIAYDQALNINPKLKYAYVGKGNALKALKRYDDAIKVLGEAFYL